MVYLLFVFCGCCYGITHNTASIAELFLQLPNISFRIVTSIEVASSTSVTQTNRTVVAKHKPIENLKFIKEKDETPHLLIQILLYI